MIGKLATAGGAVTAAVLALRAHTHWGATPEEISAVLPGDDLVPEPATSVTRAVGIDAPPDEVWRWLVQIGQDRGGMYSYDAAENLIGLDIHSTDEIHERWQHLAAGDRVVLVPPGWAGLREGYSLPVARVEPGRALVLRQAPPEHPWNAVWSFVIVPDGAGRCRLLSRSRAERPPGAALRAVTRALDLVALVMTRRMLLGIKERAEHRHRGAGVAA